MNYIAFFNFRLEDYGKIIKKWGPVIEARKKGSEKYPKILFGPVSMAAGNDKGFAVYENASAEQIMNIVMQFEPEMTLNFVPLLDVNKLTELYLKKRRQFETSQ